MEIGYLSTLSGTSCFHAYYSNENEKWSILWRQKIPHNIIKNICQKMYYYLLYKKNDCTKKKMINYVGNEGARNCINCHKLPTGYPLCFQN